MTSWVRPGSQYLAYGWNTLGRLVISLARKRRMFWWVLPLLNFLCMLAIHWGISVGVVPCSSENDWNLSPWKRNCKINKNERQPLTLEGLSCCAPCGQEAASEAACTRAGSARPALPALQSPNMRILPTNIVYVLYIASQAIKVLVTVRASSSYWRFRWIGYPYSRHHLKLTEIKRMNRDHYTIQISLHDIKHE